jgi:hypothetical protein
VRHNCIGHGVNTVDVDHLAKLVYLRFQIYRNETNRNNPRHFGSILSLPAVYLAKTLHLP